MYDVSDVQKIRKKTVTENTERRTAQAVRRSCCFEPGSD
jgi:hypothetical protein